MTISDGVREPHGAPGRPSETGPHGAGGASETGGVQGAAGIGGARGDGRGERGDAPKDAASARSGIHGWLDGVRSTSAGRLTLKIVIGVIGALLVIGGLIMVPFPGPGWLVVFAGLAVLATEFHWAHRLLGFGKRTLSAWTAWLGRRGWSVKILVVAAAAVTATAIVYFGLKLSLHIDLIVEAQKLLIR